MTDRPSTTATRRPRGETRALILATVQTHPGRSTSDYCVQIHVTIQTMTYHLDYLHRQGQIESARVGRRLAWYPAGQRPVDQRARPVPGDLAITGPLDEQRRAILRDLHADLARAEARCERQATRIAQLESELARKGNGSLVPRDRQVRA